MIYTRSSYQRPVSPAFIANIIFQYPAHPLDGSHSSCDSLNFWSKLSFTKCKKKKDRHRSCQPRRYQIVSCVPKSEEVVDHSIGMRICQCLTSDCKRLRRVMVIINLTRSPLIPALHTVYNPLMSLRRRRNRNLAANVVEEVRASLGGEVVLSRNLV